MKNPVRVWYLEKFNSFEHGNWLIPGKPKQAELIGGSDEYGWFDAMDSNGEMIRISKRQIVFTQYKGKKVASGNTWPMFEYKTREELQQRFLWSPITMLAISTPLCFSFLMAGAIGWLFTIPMLAFVGFFVGGNFQLNYKDYKECLDLLPKQKT